MCNYLNFAKVHFFLHFQIFTYITKFHVKSNRVVMLHLCMTFSIHLHRILHGLIQQRVELVGAAEVGNDLIDEIAVEDVRLVYWLFNEKTFELVVFGKFVVGIEACGNLLERIVPRERKALGTAYGLVEILAVEHYLLAHALYDARFGTPKPSTYKIAHIGLYMNIIARIAALLAVRTDIGANVLLVGRLVVRKAQVAVNAIGTVLHLQAGHRLVETCNAIDKTLRKVVMYGKHLLVLLLVSIEPRLVVVLLQFLEKIQNSFHGQKFCER